MRDIIAALETGLSTLTQLFEQGIGWLFDRFSNRASPTKPQGYFSDYGRGREVLSSNSKGFCLTGTQNLTKGDSYRNALIVGGTGSGKSSVVLLPTLYSSEGSFIVHDPSGELYQKSAGFLQTKGYKIKILNFANPNHSNSFNPIYRARKSSEINKVASQIIRISLGGAKADPFWNLQATNLLVFLITLEKRATQDQAHLGKVFQRLRSLISNLKKWEEASRRFGLHQEFQAFKGLDDRVKAGVVATVQSALQIFSDEDVAKVTQHDSISFGQFRAEKTALFIQNPVSDQEYYAVLTSLFFEQLFGNLLNQLPQAWHNDVFCLIDEAGVLQIPSLSNTIANIRKYRAGILLAVQDPFQLLEFYGPSATEAIKTNCYSKLYFAGQAGRTGEELEYALGKYEYESPDGRRYTRPLITRDELRTMKKDQALLMVGNYKPMLVKLRPYYKNRKFTKFSKLPINPKPYG